MEGSKKPKEVHFEKVDSAVTVQSYTETNPSRTTLDLSLFSDYIESLNVRKSTIH